MRCFLTTLLLALVLSPNLALGQGGMGGMGGRSMGGMSALEVVIMLGEDYDYQTPPFVDAPQVVQTFTNRGGMSNVFLPSNPNLNSVRVDITTPLPEAGQRIVVASHPASFDEAKLADFKQETKLTALRFGTNKIEFVEDANAEADTVRIWLREPFEGTADLTTRSEQLLQIAQALATDPETGKVAVPRLDLFLVEREQGDMQGMGMIDMGMGMEDETSPPKIRMRVEGVKQAIAELKKDLPKLDAEIRDLTKQYHSSVDPFDKDLVRRKLPSLVQKMIWSEDEVRRLDALLLQDKLEELNDKIKDQSSTRQQRINAKIKELIGS